MKFPPHQQPLKPQSVAINDPKSYDNTQFKDSSQTSYNPLQETLITPHVSDKSPECNNVPELTKMAIIGQVEVLGHTPEQVAPQYGLSQTRTIREILGEYVVRDGSKDNIATIQKGLGISFLSIAARCAEKLRVMLQDESKQWRASEVAIIAGISSQRGRELLSEPSQDGPVNWGEVCKTLDGSAASSEKTLNDNSVEVK